MSAPDVINDNSRRERRRGKFLLFVLGVGFLIFCTAAAGLYYALRPVTLRIAVGPSESDDQKVVQAMAEAFAAESRTVRLTPIITAGAAESLALLGGGQVDIAVGRGDLAMPSDAQSLAVLRKNYAVLWTPLGSAAKSSKRKASRKIQEISDLPNRKVGVIGRTPANVALLRVILEASGVEADKIAVVQFAPDQIEQLARDPTLDAFFTVGPLDSKITADAIAATSRSRGAPKFLGIDASDAIALKHPRYEAEEVPQSVFNTNPPWPDDKVDTVSVSHLILTRRTLSEAKAAAFFRQLFVLREVIAERAPGAAHIGKPDLEKDAEIPVHRGAAGVINGSERTFLDSYGDYFWFGLLLLSGIGSAAAWLRRYLNRDERDGSTNYRKRISVVTAEVRNAVSEQELLGKQREVDAIVRDTLECYDDGAIGEEELAAFGLVLVLFDHAVNERRADMQTGPIEPGGVRGVSVVSRR